ncbi:MAG: PEP-CTERM sorting domain-containing protein [Verrucomicrobia bacterium]|mgnify:CR=1 FL=1|jgi:hypothetical protein|nr:PEP-CTERM sorting domain-containing protein [Verrucomicrobiota bacterium]
MPTNCLVWSLFICCAATAAQASLSVVWSGPQNIYMGPGSGGVDWEYPSLSSWSLDLDSDGVDDFLFEYLASNDDFFAAPLQVSNQALARQSAFDANTWPLSVGTQIDVDPTGDTPWDSVWESDSQIFMTWLSYEGEVLGSGSWMGVDHGFQGIRFDIDGEIHYGWVQMTVSADFPGAIIHDWAYETQPGVGIMAGVVPEPSTWALFLCGGACLISRFRRFHRKAMRE